MSVHLTASQVLAGAGALCVLVWVWRAASRQAERAAQATRSGARLLSLTGRVVGTAVAITGVQWLVITHTAVHGWGVVAVLGLPALVAAYTLTRALTVTTQDMPGRRGGGHR